MGQLVAVILVTAPVPNFNFLILDLNLGLCFEAVFGLGLVNTRYLKIKYLYSILSLGEYNFEN